MTPKEAYDKISECKGNRKMVGILVQPEGRVFADPKPGHEKVHCCVCNTVCLIMANEAEHQVALANAEGYIPVCLSCGLLAFSYANSLGEHPEVIHNHKFDDSMGPADSRAAQKALSEAMGLTYQDPLQNN